jgi:hypothetical protein
MMDRDWERELAAIDKQLASVSDEQLSARVATPTVAAPPRVPPSGVPRAPAGMSGDGPTPAGVLLRLGLAVALGVGILFWPYANRCGVGLAGYLAAVSTVAAAGVWTAMSTWRARAARSHVLALALIAWGIVLAAIEILPRVGYASDPARITWGCSS